MRKVTLGLAALTLVLGLSLSRADDTSTTPTSPGNGNAISNNPGSPTAPSATPAPQVAQMPPQNWTNLQGTVQAVDPVAKTVQIQDSTGAVLKVPVDRQVSIQKDGAHVKLSQVQVGDSIILAKRNPTSQEQKSTTY